MNKAKRTVNFDCRWLLIVKHKTLLFETKSMQKELSFAEKASKRTFEKFILIARQLSSVQKQL
jgi:hypothetical protein